MTAPTPPADETVTRQKALLRAQETVLKARRLELMRDLDRAARHLNETQAVADAAGADLAAIQQLIAKL